MTPPLSNPIACLSCRAKHLKCDGKVPVCARCVAHGTQCVYTQSQRGQKGGRRKKSLAITSGAPRKSPTPASWARSSTEAMDQVMSEQGDRATKRVIGSSLLTIQATGSSDCLSDATIDVYYRTIHRSHPFIIPRRQYLRNKAALPYYLKICMAFAASHYTSQDLEVSQREASVILNPDLPEDPFRVQALLLFTITSYARCEREIGDGALTLAITIASRLGMGSETFASGQSPLWQESWRRTWWQLFIVSTMISLISGLKRPISANTAKSLPCSEEAYQECQVVSSGTLGEMQARYCTDSNHAWSSFAYLVEGASLLSRVLETRSNDANGLSGLGGKALDASLSALLLSLPSEKQVIMKPSGEIDEVMSLALMMINLAGICLHFPQSGIALSDSFGTVCGNDRAKALPGDRASQLYHSARAFKCAQAVSELVVGRDKLETITPCFSCALAFSVSTQLNALLAERDCERSKYIKDHINLALTALREIGQTWQIANMVRSQLSHYYQTKFPATPGPIEALSPSTPFDADPSGLSTSQGQIDLLGDVGEGGFGMEYFLNWDMGPLITETAPESASPHVM